VPPDIQQPGTRDPSREAVTCLPQLPGAARAFDQAFSAGSSKLQGRPALNEGGRLITVRAADLADDSANNSNRTVRLHADSFWLIGRLGNAIGGESQSHNTADTAELTTA
jgi:hypothetical protein